MFRASIIAWTLLAVPLPVFAQSTIWRTLTTDDEPIVVKAKLEAMPEIKRVKIKIKRGAAESLDIEMKEPGLRIFDGEFRLSTSFTERRLNEVRLTNRTDCARDSYALYKNIGDQLSEKYNNVLVPAADRFNFDRTMLDSDTSRSTIITSAWTNSETVALLSVRFEQTAPPKYMGGSALSRSLYELSRSIYDNSAAACGGAYYRTARIEVAYMSKQEFDQRLSSSRSDSEAASKAAADAL